MEPWPVEHDTRGAHGGHDSRGGHGGHDSRGGRGGHDSRAGRAGRATRRTPRTWTTLGLAFLGVVFVTAAVFVVAALTRDTGVLGFLGGALLAAVPVVPAMQVLMWLDRYEPEPGSLLVTSFLWGATVAAGVALVINSTVAALLSARGAGPGVEVLVVAPFVEEAAKGLLLLGVLWRRRAELDSVVDGVVLGGMVGLGFAFTENILYFGRLFLAGGTAQGLLTLGVTFFVRAVLSPLAHPLFTACTGAGVALAAGTRRRTFRVLAPVFGYVVAALLHAAWNTAASAGLAGFLNAYAFVMVPIFLVALAGVLIARAREGRVVARWLPSYAAAGWLTPQEAAILSSLSARRAQLRAARAAGGRAAQAIVQEYQAVATELAFLRERAARRGPDPDFAEVEQALLRRLASLRGAPGWR